MNKEVIYLEPEDDITDILTKLQQAEQKLVALVPPKKATMLRSAVNMKLVARVAKECEKVVVVVTADPAIVKMAMAAKIPVAKTLQSRPVVPTEEQIKAAEASEQIIDEDLEDDPKAAEKSKKGKNASKASNSAPEASAAKSADTLDLSEESLENASKEAEKAKAKKKKAQKDENASFIQKYRKWIMIGSAAVVVLIVALVWAFVFAPAVTITVAISSTPNNFSESIRFTTDENAKNLEEGTFYAEQISVDNNYKTDISATGEEDRGEKATGKVTVSTSFTPMDVAGDGGFELNVPVGARFTNNSNNKVYISTEDKTRFWDGEEQTIACDNGTISTSGGLSALRRTCTFSVTVNVEAENAGEDYDVAATNRWAPYQGANVSSGSPISGGTTNMVKVISDEDIDKVKEMQLAEHTTGAKEDILNDLSKDVIPIESSFKGEVTEVKTTPEQSEEVKDGVTPIAELKIAYSMYVIPKEDVKAYIELKLALADDQKIYSIGEPYIERFSDIENDARLKTVVETGPTVTEEDILEKVKGMKTGQVASVLRSINGVSSVNISTSYFWVWSVPNDPARITIKMEVEER